MKRKVLKPILVLLLLTLTIAAVYAASIITDIHVKHLLPQESELSATVKSCIQSQVGKPYWVASGKQLEQALNNCDPMITGYQTRYLLLGEMELILETVSPIIKIETADSCLLIQSSAVSASVSLERCQKYPLPLLDAEMQEINTFVQDYATQLVKHFLSIELQPRKITYKGDQVAPWYAVELTTNKTVYLLPTSALQEKMILLRSAVQGLNDAEEPYSVIDLRFDRVVYK